MTGYAELQSVGQLCAHRRGILDQEEVKPHKVRYYLEQRDPHFAEKMAEVLCVYRQVKILKQAAAASKNKRPSDAVAIISYDREAGYPGDRDNGPGFAARTGRPCDLRT